MRAGGSCFCASVECCLARAGAAHIHETGLAGLRGVDVDGDADLTASVVEAPALQHVLARDLVAAEYVAGSAHARMGA